MLGYPVKIRNTAAGGSESVVCLEAVIENTNQEMIYKQNVYDLNVIQKNNNLLRICANI